MSRFHAPWRRVFWLALAGLVAAGPAHAVLDCTLDGEHVNPANGNTTAGKTGLMRCVDRDTKTVQREQALQNGVFMGVVRYFRNGEIEKEYSVNEKGNRDGLSREWNVDGGKRVLVREETVRNSRTVGLAKSWYPTGERRRLTWYGDEEREQAAVDFDKEGRVTDLRCTAKPVFLPDFDDRAACGFAGAPSTVTFTGAKGVPVMRVVFEKGERRRTETLWESGGVRELRETSDAGVLERRFAADGTRLREAQFVRVPARETDARPRTVKVLEQEYHASGKLVTETRWTPDERFGASVASEARWYLNGQPRQRIEYSGSGEQRTRREATFHDNGKPASEGTWVVGAGGGRYERERPTGTHKTFDEQGRVRSERVYDDKGRITREREFDESGKPVKDDEVFEDGSRKSVGR